MYATPWGSRVLARLAGSSASAMVLRPRPTASKKVDFEEAVTDQNGDNIPAAYPGRLVRVLDENETLPFSNLKLLKMEEHLWGN